MTIPRWRDAELPDPSRRAYCMAMPLHVPTYTVDELENFPNDGNRYELLDGFLIVTPAPGFPHQLIASRLATWLSNYLAPAGKAVVVGPGAVELRPKTHLEPDVLVLPAPVKGQKEWRHFTHWWLAIEVLSRSSKFYDREVKRDAYLALSVAEVWLVDRREAVVLVSRRDGARDVEARERLVWSPPELPKRLTIDLKQLFAGLE
jgi:Uma2 family endonuclease